MADCVDISLIPYAENGTPPASLKPVERKLREGYIVRIGRQVVKDGLVQTKTNPHGLDIWYVSKVISRNHAELWAKDGQIYIRDIGSSSGTFLNKMRLSPSGKGSRPYPLKNGDNIQFGVDYKGKIEDIFKAVALKVAFPDQWSQMRKKQGNPVKFQQALKNLLLATNPYASSNDAVEDTSSISTECCICIGAIGPYQALFISPCSHSFHYKCVSVILSQSAMFQCPMCRQVANLTASVSMESLNDIDEAENTPTNGGSDSDLSMVGGTPIAGQLTQMMHSLQGRLDKQEQPIVAPDLTTSPVSRPTSAISTSAPHADSSYAINFGINSKRISHKISTFLGRKPNILSPPIQPAPMSPNSSDSISAGQKVVSPGTSSLIKTSSPFFQIQPQSQQNQHHSAIHDQAIDPDFVMEEELD